MAQQISTNTFGVAKWIVSSDASQGTHTTIQAAINSASSGDTIYVRDGTYTENPTLKVGVNLAALVSNDASPKVIINGNCTLSTAGTVTIAGIGLQTNSAALLTVSGSVASILNLVNCNINCLNNTGITYSSSSSSSAINMYNCTGDLGTTGIGLYTMTSAGKLLIYDSNFTNSGASTTASSNSSGTVDTRNSVLPIPLSTSSSGIITGFYLICRTNSINTTCITTAGTGTTTFDQCVFASGSASSLSVGTGTTVNLYNSRVSSSNTNALTGAGTISMAGVYFGGNTGNNVTTQQVGTLQGMVGGSINTGFIGEQIRSFVAATGISLSNNIPANVTSINLTAGVWDISCCSIFSYTGTTTQLTTSISATSATLPGNVGDQELTINNITGSFTSLSIPSYRATLTSTTTYYLVVSAGFSTGAVNSYGRISATRVG